jgi:hypothetical protein
MPRVSVATQEEGVHKENSCIPRSLIYLPKEGLQGEDIPSHILWENANVKSIEVSFCPPLKFKEVFNAQSWKIQGNKIIIEKVELDGYIGLSFDRSIDSRPPRLSLVSQVLSKQQGLFTDQSFDFLLVSYSYSWDRSI